MTITNKFTEASTTTKTSRLDGTATLVAEANKVVATVIDKLEQNFDDNEELFEDSKVNANKMDELVEKLTNNYEGATADFLAEYDEQCLTQMLKSQMSKRSHLKAKGADMNMNTWTSMMNAAICEHLLRQYMGKPKHASHGNPRSVANYTPEYLEELKGDQGELRRELRNIQSKQCTLRKKYPDNYAELDHYQMLEAVAQELKEARETEGAQHTSRLALIKESLQDVDPAGLNLEEALQLIAELQGITGGDK